MIKMALNEYKEMKKRGQVSFFIIVGVLFLIIVGFAIYLTSLAAKERAEREVITTQQMPTEVQEINNYVVSCLGKLFDRGLVLLGQSGGRIYASDGGPTPNTIDPIKNEGKIYLRYDLDGDGYREQIPHLIFRPIGPKTTPFSFDEPVYPWSDSTTIHFPYKNAAHDVLFKHRIFGHNQLPILMKKDNPILAPTSIEYQLQVYLENSISLEECSDFDIFSAFTVSPDNSLIAAAVNITDSDVAVKLHWPLDITNNANGEKRELTDFYIQPQIRFKDFYNAIYDLIDEETHNIQYDLPKTLGSVTIKRATEDVIEKDDLINITTPNLIKGQDYNFYFARKNRRPALLYIPDQNVVVWDTLIIDISNIGLYPPHPPNVFVDTPYGLDELALDPDEDSLTYNSPDLLTGMSIESNTGKITWTPTTGQEGTHKIEVHVTDGELGDYQEVTINVELPP